MKHGKYGRIKELEARLASRKGNKMYSQNVKSIKEELEKLYASY